VTETMSAIGLIAAATVTGIFTLLAQKLRRENRGAHDEVVVVLHDISETLESIDDNVTRMDEWQQTHQEQHDRQT
tara:strand:- start:205 stop:429 length:225 start_codon:yes stop_codon:yes gene_type:complete